MRGKTAEHLAEVCTWVSRVCRLNGILLIAVFCTVQFHGILCNAETFVPNSEQSIKEETPDFNGWGQIRINAYKQSMQQKVDPPLGMLKIEKIPLHVAVFEGTSDLVLNRGVGRVKETEKIGGLGNIGIAGHRDGFFRHLGTILKGDQIQLVTPKTTYTYLVDKILIVTPTDYYVLRNGVNPSITLVTCYPFHYKGHAPQRFIVKATLKNSETTTSVEHSVKKP